MSPTQSRISPSIQRILRLWCSLVQGSGLEFAGAKAQGPGCRRSRVQEVQGSECPGFRRVVVLTDGVFFDQIYMSIVQLMPEIVTSMGESSEWFGI